MSTNSVTKSNSATPAKREIQPEVEPKRTKEQVLSQVAEDAVVRPQEYLKDSTAPIGE